MAIRPLLSLKARAIGLLAQREHSRAELRRKLLRIEQRQRLAAVGAAEAGEADSPVPDDDSASGETAVDALLDALATDGYLDETRFVESRLHLRSGRFGAQRIQQELAQHGLKLGAEQQASLRATELERAREVWHKRFGAEPARDASEQARQTRFLLARGFAADIVRRLLKA
ncbi:regulatory protein RecX [Pelomonas aquatica]|jgi:regulatory protein|uniref:Regulatory protein RecX n=1 Tax=Pelomonas aquatica TaxID=431058 RepID=A0A9X4R7I8_9BURK|nr:RecX family transcriptional regulator [Pelomonas aquatica]MCY4752983.1 RecX family transcriptional regulator [Pelomonas aquatica]MDG0862078.1 recombination regulator RecX [Pelomonas aquatica]